MGNHNRSVDGSIHAHASMIDIVPQGIPDRARLNKFRL